jgi:hypothetical protein
LRNYLLSILIDREKLNETEMELITYLRKLEIAYPNRSYEDTKLVVPAFEKLNVNSAIKLQSVQSKNDSFNAKDLVKFINKNNDYTQSGYSQVAIEWIREWSKKHQSQIIAESIIFNPALINDDQLQPLDEQCLWLTLIEMENLKLIQEWIKFSFSPSSTTQLSPAEFPFQTKLTQEMCDLLLATPYMSTESKETLLNFLATFNVYCSQEKSNFKSYTLRISSSDSMFDLASFASRDDSFHLKVILNFLTKNSSLMPFDFLWSYLNFYDSLSQENSAQSLLAHSQLIEINSSNAIRMMLAFRQNLKLTCLDPATFFSNVCTKNFEFYLGNQVENLQISNLFTHKYKEHHLVALAMSLYFDTPLSLNESNKLEHLLDEYPSIRLIIDLKHVNQPISLYALMQEHTKLEVSKFFQWQKSNTIGLSMTAKSNQHMLSFENVDFAKRFSYKESLDYAFFIKQGRPFFCFLLFHEDPNKEAWQS